MYSSHQELFIFDIETIPDISCIPNLLDTSLDNNLIDKQLFILEQREKLRQYHLQITDGKNAFLRQPFHQVVAISFLRASLNIDDLGNEFYSFKEVRSGGTLESSENELIEGFFQTIEKIKPRLVSFNGRGFDLPVLKYRAIKYGIAAPGFYQSGDKWNSYLSRYSSDWHCDLLEVLSDFGASARIKLNEICAILNLPGKIGIDGSQVTSMIDQGRLQEIREYCESDVLNTYLVYLYTMRHIGRLSQIGLQRALEEIEIFLTNSKLTHWQSFLKAWKH